MQTFQSVNCFPGNFLGIQMKGQHPTQKLHKEVKSHRIIQKIIKYCR